LTNMATNFKTGDLVWAKMKGFQAWPGKIVEPKENIKRPSKKNVQFVYFYGSENYAWIQEENIYRYPEYKSKYEGSARIPKGFKEALEAIENEHQAMLASGKLEDLPSIDEEVALMQKATEGDGEEAATAESPAPTKKGRKSDGGNKSAKKDDAKKEKVKKPKEPKDGNRKSKLMSPVRKGGTKRPSGSSLHDSTSTTSSPAKKFFSSNKSPMRDDYHFTHTLGAEMGSAKLEDIDEVMSEEKTVSKTIIPTPLRIGFLGLGIMGQGMVMNLLRSGHEVTVWNRTATKCREFVKAGALKGNNPADVVQSCDITFTCVADSTAVRDITFGNMGVLDGISKGKCYVEMSTVDEETVQDVADAIMARGGAFLEAPVCGSRVPALEGQLLILCSGDRKLFDDCYSCFEAMGKKSFYLGNEVGTATRMKLINNMVLGTVVASVSEGMALADKLSIDLEDFAEVLSLGSLSCRTVNHKAQAIVNSRYDPHFPLQHQQKDLRLVLGLGDSVEQPLHLAAAANELYKKAKRMGYGEGDMAAVFKAASEFGDNTELSESSSK